MSKQNSNNFGNKAEQFLEKEVNETNISIIESKDILSKNISSFSPFLIKTLKIVSAVIIASIISVIIIISEKNIGKSNRANFIISDKSSMNSSSFSSVPLSSRPGLSSSNYSPELFKPSDISFEEAEKLLDIKKIGENHQILNETYELIKESLKVFNNFITSLKPMGYKISYSIPEFLEKFSDSTLKIVKEDINLYNSKYEELEEKANNLIEIVSETIKSLRTHLYNMKEYVNEIYEQFENITKSFSLPLFLDKISLINSTESNNNIKRFYSEKLQKYKEEVKNFNNKYNSFFNYIKSIIVLIIRNIKEISNSMKDVNGNIAKSILNYGKLLRKFDKKADIQKIHENLLIIKQSFIDIKKNMSNEIENIEDKISSLEDLNKNNILSKKFENESLILIDNINLISEEIILEINDMRRQNGEKELEYSNSNASPLNDESIIKEFENSFEILMNVQFAKMNELQSIIISTNVEEKTSIDLLFIIDITVSMDVYVEEVKKSIIDIINRIENKCPGIDINLGFIGYRDIEEGDIIDIEFTKDHEELKNNISKIYAFGGGDYPKDVVWAFERALNKTWKSNARFIVFVADAPNHGDKYNIDKGSDSHYYDKYPNVIPDRRDLEDIFKELADNGVSIFCMKLIEDIDRMLEIFGNVYKNYEKSRFQIVPMDSISDFSDIVVDSSLNIYEKQRMNDVSLSFEYNKNKLRVYLIEINPILTTITNKELYKNNDGHPYVSEYFDQDRELTLKEMKEDLEFSSHGQIKVEFVTHILHNDFPKYTKIIELSNGEKDYKFDEETYISMSKKKYNPDKGSWTKMFKSKKYQEIDSFQFDYNYIVKKYNLDKLKKNNAFDQVWIYGIDPLTTFETMMIGSNPFYINGDPLIKDCKNFIVLAGTFSRRDSNLHALGHSFEDILSYAFTGEYNSYEKEYDDSTQDKYNKLNYWEKFILTNKNSKGKNAGVGNIHFPFNGETDYDYSNENEVYSNWEYWENYPNIKGEKKKYNKDAWMNFEGNKNIINDKNSCKDPDRLYVRFWMYLLPHIDGYTETGHLNNWWDYITNCDYVTSIISENKNIIGTIGEEVHLDYKVFYKSGFVESISNINAGNNIKINGDCVSFENNKLIGYKKGSCSVIIYRDGNSIDFIIDIN